MLKFAVIGNPIKHSRSPQIHQKFAEQFGINLTYERLLAPPNEFEHTLNQFIDQGGLGVNVTVPFKIDAFNLCQQEDNHLSHDANLAGAVNTLLVNNDSTLVGHNTDGIGLVSDIEKNIGKKLANQNVLIIGAGGATQGVINPILNANCRHLHIANRTTSKAQHLAELFSSDLISTSSLDDIPEEKYDIIINATSASMGGNVPAIAPTLFSKDALVYDMMYHVDDTAFIQLAKQHGAEHCYDGLGMLIEQAAYAFKIWHHVMPDTNTLISTLRTSI